MDNFIQNIDINDIIPTDVHQNYNNDDELKNLEESIKQYGIVEPLIVKPNGEKYEIISGNKRYFIAKKIGIETIPVLIRNLEKNFYQHQEKNTNKFINKELSIDENNNHLQEKNYIKDLKENRNEEPTGEYQRRIYENSKNPDIINLSILSQKEFERNDEEMNNQQNIETQNVNLGQMNQNIGQPTFGGSFFPSLEDEPTNMNMTGENIQANTTAAVNQTPNNNLIDLTDVNNENLNNTVPNMNTTPQQTPNEEPMNTANQNPIELQIPDNEPTENKFINQMNLNMNENPQVTETPIQPTSQILNSQNVEMPMPNNDIQQVNMNAKMQMDMQEPNLNPIDNSVMVGVQNQDFQIPDLNQTSVNIPNINETVENNAQFDMTQSVNPTPIVESFNTSDMGINSNNNEMELSNIENNNLGQEIQPQETQINTNLDMINSINNTEANIPNTEALKDVTPVKECIKNLAENLQNFGFVIHFTEEDLEKTSKITIEIEK